MPDVPVPDLPSGGAYGYPATLDPQADSATHQWHHGAIVDLDGDVTGPSDANTVVAIEGFPVLDNAPANNEVLTWDSGDGAWKPKPAPGAGGSFPTYFQEAAPATPTAGETWIRTAEGYPDQYGIGTFFFDGASWLQFAPVVLDEGTGQPLGLVTVGTDGNIVIERFDGSGNVLATMFVGTNQVYLSDLFGSNLNLNETDANLQLSTGQQVRVLLASDSTGLTLTDAINQERVAIKDDGSGLTLTNTSGSGPVVLLKDDGSGLALGDVNAPGVELTENGLTMERQATDSRRVQLLIDPVAKFSLRDANGNGRVAMDADGVGLWLFDDGGQPRARLFDGVNGSGLLLTSAVGAAQQQLGETTIGFFAATPVGQQVFIDPVTITPEQIGNILIAFGFMAPS